MRQQVEKLKKEIGTLRRGRSGTSHQTFDPDSALLAPAALQMDEVESLKKLAGDDSLTEDTRQAAQANLQDHLAAHFEVGFAERQLNRLATEQRLVSAGLVSAEVQAWLGKQRIQRHTTAIVRVVGRDASMQDLKLLAEEDVEDLSGGMTRVEKLRFAAAIRALQSDEPAREPEPEPELEPQPQQTKGGVKTYANPALQ